MKFVDRKFTSGEVSQKLGIPQSTLQPWLNRGVITGHGGGSVVEGGGAQGKHRQFSFQNVMQIALAHALIANRQAGVRDAFEAAGLFTNVEGGIYTVDFKERALALPFHTKFGRTLLVLAGGKSAEILQKKDENFDPIARGWLNWPLVYATLDVTAVFFRVADAFEVDASEILDSAYAPDGTTAKGGKA